MDNTFATATDWEMEFKRARAECDEHAKMCVELQAKVRRLEADIDELTSERTCLLNEQRFNQGMIAGLKFAVRCNGVSGKEVS